MRAWSHLGILGLCLTAVACSDDGEVDLGSDGEPGVVGDELSDYAGVWVGYMEGYRLKSGSDRIRIVLDEAGQGTIELGEAARIPPPTDPNVGYPPDAAEMFEATREDPLHDGVEHAIHDARLEVKRVRFVVDPLEYVGPWCRMQTPQFDPSHMSSEGTLFYSCAPHLSLNRKADGTCDVWVDLEEDPITLDCGKVATCGSTCRCDANSCDARSPADWGINGVEFDAALVGGGDSLEGTMAGTTVRLDRE